MAIRANLWLLAAMLAVASSFSLPAPTATLRRAPSIPALPATGAMKRTPMRRLRGGGEVKAASSSGGSTGLFSPKSMGRAMLSEAFGTFIVVLLGCGAVAGAGMQFHPSGVLAVALIWGVAVAGAATVCGPVSGAHFNPAISVALATTKGSSAVPIDAKPSSWLPCYILAQFAGALVASGLVAFFFWGHLGPLRIVNPLSAPPPGVFGCYPNSFGVERAIAAEIVGTGLLAAGCVSFGSAWQVGGWLATLIAIFGPISGASFNPAREFAPRLMASLLGFDWAKTHAHTLLYLLSPVIGAVLGAMFTTFMRSED